MNGLREAFDRIAADVPVYGDLDHAIGQAARQQRRRNAVIAGLAAATTVVAVVAGAALLTPDDTTSQLPASPATVPGPTSGDDASSSATWEPPEPLRRSASRVVQLEQRTDGTPPTWSDPRDVPIAAVDIVSVDEGQDFRGGSSWRFRLAARPPLDPADRVIAYGVVVDADGDRRADCQIGISNDAPARGDLHVWVTNLSTRQTAVQDGPPYGFPVEFAHPAEEGMQEYGPAMHFGFLGGLGNPAPCDPFGESSTFYAWSSATEGGQVLARDHAPDAAWMPISFAGQDDGRP